MTNAISPKSDPNAMSPTFSRAPERGKENIAQDDVLLPRIAIAQKTNSQLEPDKPDYIPGLKLFDLFNTGTKEVYGAGPITFVVIRMDKRAMQFDNSNNVVDYDVPLNDPRLLWTSAADGSRVKPVATLFYDFLILLADDDHSAAVLSLKGTGIKTARQLNLLLMRQRGDAWKQQFTLTSTRGMSGSFSYGVYTIRPAGKTPDDLMRQAEQTYEALHGRRVETDREVGDEPAADGEPIPF